VAAESFFDRWAKHNADKRTARPADEPQRTSAPPIAPAPTAPERLPTIEDVAQLTPQSDFTPFVARGVDEGVKRSALKKLFADPHFNVMDGLDVYIEDYHHFTPIPPAMLAALHHAKDLLNPLARLGITDEPDKAVARLLEDPEERSAAEADAGAEQSAEPSASLPMTGSASEPINSRSPTRPNDDSVQGL